MATTQMTQHDTWVGGNTKTPTCDKTRGRKWFLTVNNPDDTITQRIDEAHKWVYQWEKGEEEKTLHIHALLCFKNARTFTSIKKAFPKAHITVPKNIKQVYDYCTKVETRVDGPYSKGYPLPVKIINTLRPWQQAMADRLKIAPDDRKIVWVYDKIGKMGKTQLCKWLIVKHNAILAGGRGADIRHCIAKKVEKMESIELVVYNFTRSVEGYVSYEAIEQVKDGLLYSGKYEGTQCVFNSPHVWVFANFEPEYDKLSIDRWDVIEITQGTASPTLTCSTPFAVATPQQGATPDDDDL